MTQTLIKYIQTETIPQYAAFDKAHREDHARAVIERAMSMGEKYDIDPDMLYTAAACHDLGLAVPAYNYTEGHTQFHPKGRDNGFVLTIDGLRIYIAGDTEDIPEMAQLPGITVLLRQMQ